MPVGGRRYIRQHYLKLLSQPPPALFTSSASRFRKRPPPHVFEVPLPTVLISCLSSVPDSTVRVLNSAKRFSLTGEGARVLHDSFTHALCCASSLQSARVWLLLNLYGDYVQGLATTRRVFRLRVFPAASELVERDRFFANSLQSALGSCVPVDEGIGERPRLLSESTDRWEFSRIAP